MGSKPEDFQYQLLHWADDRGSAISGVSIAFFSVAFLAVCLRMLARKTTGAPLGYDDFFIVIAVVSPTFWEHMFAPPNWATLYRFSLWDL